MRGAHKMFRCKHAKDQNDLDCKDCDGIQMVVNGREYDCDTCPGYEASEEWEHTSYEIDNQWGKSSSKRNWGIVVYIGIMLYNFYCFMNRTYKYLSDDDYKKAFIIAASVFKLFIIIAFVYAKIAYSKTQTIRKEVIVYHLIWLFCIWVITLYLMSNYGVEENLMLKLKLLFMQ